MLRQSRFHVERAHFQTDPQCHQRIFPTKTKFQRGVPSLVDLSDLSQTHAFHTINYINVIKFIIWRGRINFSLQIEIIKVFYITASVFLIVRTLF